MPDALSDDELAAYFALRRASDRLTHAVASQLLGFGLTEVQFTILAQLGAAADGLAMSQLARAITGSKSGLTYQISKLADRGLVARVPDADDERSIRVVLTDDGKALLKRALPAHVLLVRELFLDRLGSLDVATLRRALDDIAT